MKEVIRRPRLLLPRSETVGYDMKSTVGKSSFATIENSSLRSPLGLPRTALIVTYS